MEKEIVNVIEGLISAFNAENDAAYGTVIENTISKLKASGYNFSDPNTFNTMFMFQENTVTTAIAKQFHELCKNPQNESKADFVFTNYRYLENHIRVLIEGRCGSSCVVDRSKTIIREYLKWLVTGELNEFNTEEDHFWVPKFGTLADWFEFCDGLYRIYHGQPDAYLKSYQKLITADIRKYRHLSHKWFLKLKNEEPVLIGNTWDEKKENPMNHEYCQDKDNYFVFKMKLPKHLRENFKEIDPNDFLCGSYVNVPKSDVEKIYVKTEEIYI